MSVTKEQFKALNDLYDYYNRKLFYNLLPGCLVSLVRSKGFHGAFAPEKWQRKVGDALLVHEIVLNANTMDREEKLWHSTLCHEMAHLYIQTHGKELCRGYHSRAWARVMKHIGLQPSHTGLPGGRETGRKMTHYIIDGGPFDRAYRCILENNITRYKLPYDTVSSGPHGPWMVSRDGKGSNKTGYVCHCGNKVWGKASLHISCNDCGQNFSIVDSQ
ncbi:MAG: SprT-like domain-containing protein [Bacteroidetes bacterium]|nr:SprT-like domain-containing protein [Bacteroidota bacterium]